MRATIIDLNYARDFYIFECEDGTIGYFELLEGPDLEINESLLGSFDHFGKTEVTAEDSREKLHISIEDFCSFEVAKSMIK